MMLLTSTLILALGGAYLLHQLIADDGYGRPVLALYVSFAWVGLSACSLLTLLTAFGAWALARFDVARVPASGN